MNNGKKTKLASATHEDTEHILSIISSLLTSLSSDSPARLRLLAKFVEDDYEKVDRLIEIREEVEARVTAGSGDDDEAQAEAEEMDDDEKYLNKLDKGLFSLQLADYIVAWLCMEDDGVSLYLYPFWSLYVLPDPSRRLVGQARDHIKMLLARKDRSLSDVIKVLTEYHSNIGEFEPTAEGDESKAIAIVEEEERVMTELEEKRGILEHLLTYLVSLDS